MRLAGARQPPTPPVPRTPFTLRSVPRAPHRSRPKWGCPRPRPEVGATSEASDASEVGFGLPTTIPEGGVSSSRPVPSPRRLPGPAGCPKHAVSRAHSKARGGAWRPRVTGRETEAEEEEGARAGIACEWQCRTRPPFWRKGHHSRHSQAVAPPGRAGGEDVEAHVQLQSRRPSGDVWVMMEPGAGQGLCPTESHWGTPDPLRPLPASHHVLRATVPLPPGVPRGQEVPPGPPRTAPGTDSIGEQPPAELSRRQRLGRASIPG